MGYKKKATFIFTEVKKLVQYFQLAITKDWTIWDSITLVVTLNFLHNFEIKITSLLHLNNNDLKEIQQIVISTKVANIVKGVTGQTANLVIIIKNNYSNKQLCIKSNKKYFHYDKKKYDVKDCYSKLKWKLYEEEKTKEEIKQA